MIEEKTKYVKETFIWPILAGAIVFSLKGPSSFVIALVFFCALSILVAATTIEKYVVCGAVVLFQVINGMFVSYENDLLAGPLHSSPELWIANRLLYVVGLTFFLPPLVEPLLTTDRKRTIAICAGCVFLFAGYSMAVHERATKHLRPINCYAIVDQLCLQKPKPESWYSLENLLDDVAVGFAAGLFFMVLSKKRDENALDILPSPDVRIPS
jgi:hypothetical protein